VEGCKVISDKQKVAVQQINEISKAEKGKRNKRQEFRGN